MERMETTFHKLCSKFCVSMSSNIRPKYWNILQAVPNWRWKQKNTPNKMEHSCQTLLDFAGLELQKEDEQKTFAITDELPTSSRVRSSIVNANVVGRTRINPHIFDLRFLTVTRYELL